ncbi:MAG TPA: class F sortase [Candidatus Dormibacteraeota bacterium]|nr:class F sortase [Candidatus Dormibacteraeota bacterium]
MLGTRRGFSGRLTATLTAAVVVAACANAQASGGQPARPSPVASSSAPASAPAADQLPVPTSLIDPGLDLQAGPVDVPLELQIPALRISAAVLGVGLTPKNVMDTPTGSGRDPVWQKVFWYRGGGIPGDATTATIAGHVDDVLGRPAIFARLKDLRPGDPIVVRDTRTGLEVDFLVTETATYTLRQTLDPAILAQIYGSGPVAGQGPEPSPDGLSHLTLITCTGHWVSGLGMFDHRLAVYAVSLPSQFPPRGSRS